jgi:hypothetical protein
MKRKPTRSEVQARYTELQDCFGGAAWDDLTAAEQDALVKNARTDDPDYWKSKGDQ